MPFTFIDIEQRRKKVIFVIFSFLVLFYFFGAWLLYAVARVFFLFSIEKDLSRLFFTPAHHLLYLFLGALVIGALHWYDSTAHGVNKILKALKAASPDKDDDYHRRLINIVEEVSVATGGRPIDCVVLPLFAMNSFSAVDFRSKPVIGVTEGVLSRLNRAQLEAVIAHEAAHIISGDTLIKTVTASAFSLYAVLLSGLGKSISQQSCHHNRKGPHPLMLALYLTTAVIHFFAKLMSMFVSRQCEYRADAVAVRLVRDPLGLAQALYRISRAWRGGGVGYEYMESLFVVNPNYSALDESESLTADLFSTHPPMHKRLRILLDMAHSDHAALTAAEQPYPERRSDEVRVVPVREPRWFVAGTIDNWLGPFTAFELAALKDVRHDWFVRRESSDKIDILYEDQDLLSVFKNNRQNGTQGCPRCGNALSQGLYEGVPLYQCGMCRGFFLKEDKIPRILVREEQGFSPEIKRKAEAVKQTARTFAINRPAKMNHEFECPWCGQVMIRNFYNYAYPIEVDRCYSCQAIWFDKDELEVLQYLVEQARTK